MSFFSPEHDKTLGLRWLAIILLFIASTFMDYSWQRMFHMVFGFAWWSLLFFLAVILIPIINNLKEDTVADFVGIVVPRVFRTVSIVGFMAVMEGLFLLDQITKHFQELSYMTRDGWSIAFTISTLLTTGIYLFHLFLEKNEIKVAMKIAEGKLTMKDEEVVNFLKNLKRTPRVGFILITFTVVAMIIKI